MGPVNPPTCHSNGRYIITTTYYLTRWVEVALVKNCIANIASKFIFENIITQFRCPQSLISDYGNHFINDIVASFLHNFMIQHHKRNPYHAQENGTMEAFDKILERGLTKICSANWDNWDERVLVTLWVFLTTFKHLHKYTPFQLVYGREVVVPTEFIVPNLFIAWDTHIT